MHAIYERIVIEGGRFFSLRLTQAAHRHGLALALALPEAVMALPTLARPTMARPTGFDREDAIHVVHIPIERRWPPDGRGSH
jgi:hypothetical protein